MSASASRSRGPSRLDLLSGLASVVVIALGASSLLITGQLHPLAAAVALPSSLLALVGARRLRVSSLVWNLLGLAALGVSVGAWRVGHSHPVTVLAHLTVFFQVYRLLARRGDSGLGVCYLIAFSQLALASILTIHFSFLLVCAAFAVAVAWALLLLRVKEAFAAAAEDGGSVPHDPGRLLSGPFVAYATVLTAALLVGAVAIFLLMPRLQIGLANRYSATVQVGGFSEEVRLGDVGLIQRRSEPVMRVEVTDRDGRALDLPLYYHGLALDRFDGHRWKLGDATPVPLINRRFPERDERPVPDSATLTQRYTLEPINSRVVFYVRDAVELLVPLHELEAASTEGYFFPLDSGRPEYVVHSRATRPSPEEFRAASDEYPDDVVARYLQTPELSDRVVDLGRRWVGSGETRYDSALVVQQRLRQDFVYSLEQPSAGTRDPLDHFLFETQEGHCEFFATAMALLLRSQGIPTRVVNGFHGGDFNPAGDYFIVRQRHAHSWVEVYFPGLGWQLFDPTPEGDDVSGDVRLGVTSLLRGWIDIAGLRWRTLVLDYDQMDQIDALDRGFQAMASHDVLGVPDLAIPGLPRLGGVDRGALPWGLAVLLAVLALALALIVVRALRRASGANPEIPRGDARRFVRLMRRWANVTARKLEIPGYPTPLEVAREWESRGGPLRAVPVVERYYAVVFGGTGASAKDVADARGLLRGLRGMRRLP
jgi:protein-glutamine gamma-glutamyltransferase